MKTEKSVGVVDEGTYIHIFQLSKGQDEHPLSKVAVARGNDTPMVLFSYDALDPDGTGIFKIVGTNGFVVPVGNTTQRPDYPTYAAVDTGTLRLNSTLNQLEIWNGAIWSIVGSDSGNISIIDQQITPDGSSTAYVLTQVATAASIIVSLNGVVQIPNDGYTVTGNSLTFVEPPLTTDIVDIRFLTGVNAPSVLYNSSGNSSVQVTDTPDVVTTVNNVVKSRVNAVGLSVTGNITASGNITAGNFVGNGAALTDVAVRTTGSWTVATGTNTYSITVPINGNYQIWVRGNIPNGILVYQATVSVSNNNVAVLGTQRAWNYTGAGSPISLTTMPTQIVGAEGTISTATVVTTTANVFDFVISNTSGSPQTILWGYVTL